MFYTSDDIENQLHCMHCNEQFDVPKSLPCGNTICERCENEIWKEFDKEIECQLCHQSHKRPVHDGFPLNRLIERLLHTQPRYAYNRELYDEAMNKLENIDKHLKNLKELQDIQSPEDKIRTHCDHLRQDVQKSYERRKSKLNQFLKQLIDRIDEYEKACLDNLKGESRERAEEPVETKEETQLLINETQKKSKKWRDYLKRLDLDENEINNVLNEAKNVDNDLVTRKRISDYFTFFGEPLHFNDSELELKPENIGKLFIKEPKNLNSERLKNARVQEVNYKNTSIICKSAITLVNANDVALAYLMYTHDTVTDLYTYQLRLRLYNYTSATLLSEMSELYNSQHINCLSLASINSNIYLLFQDQQGDYWLRMYDLSLQLIKATQLNYETLSIHSLNNQLYVVSNKQPFIHVLDKNLNELKCFGQQDDANNPFFIKNINNVQFQNDLIFIYDDGNVYVLLLESGLLLKKIETNMKNCKFQVDPTLRVILMRPDEKKFFIFDLNSSLIDEFTLNDVKNLHSFRVSRDGVLFTNDNENGLLTIR